VGGNAALFYWLAGGFAYIQASAVDRTGWKISAVQFQIMKDVKEKNK
jgi:hypothetical protein